MQVEFRFNGRHEIILLPDNGEDKNLLALAFREHAILRLGLPPKESPDSIMIVADAPKQER